MVGDKLVLQAQQWVNSVYGGVAGYTPIPEDGKTGWTTVRALIRALQHELGVAPLSDTFGPATMGTLTTAWPVIDAATTNQNIIKIVQSALYCKGYNGSGMSGTYDSTTSASVTRLRTDMGVEGSFPPGVVPKVFAALLTMDAYVLLSGASPQIRNIQQWLNATYITRRNFRVVPCDGRFSREVQKSLLLAIQFEIGMDDETATGRFGPGTQAGLKDQAVLGPGSLDQAKRFVRLFQAAMRFNGWNVPFDGSYTPAVADAVAEFQAFARLLPANGIAGYQTWASLLVSSGDPTRRGTACDCVTEITPARAFVLKVEGYGTVGRYLTNAPGSSLNKKIQPGELQTITSAGLSAFPIYQTSGHTRDYFSPEQGAQDALAAMEAARDHGFGRGTTIYYAVDFDALDSDVTQRIIPHFRALATRLRHFGGGYPIGVYGPRNVCARLASEGLTVSSFVSDMSTGFSGNLGFPLPADWAFDQISTITVGDGDGAVEIDNDVASGRDPGQSLFAPPAPPSRPLDVGFAMSRRDDLLRDLTGYLDSIGVREMPLIWPNSTEHALDLVLAHDALITGLSRIHRMRKALIQGPIFWEIRKLTPEDALADLAVTAYYGYRTELEAWEALPPDQRLDVPMPTPPFVLKEDASTGLGQIFARTAIAAHNHGIVSGLIDERPLDPDDWHVTQAVWRRLREDPDHNISTVPLVLINGAHESGVGGDPLAYDTTQLGEVLARYNGTGAGAEQYGHELSGVYAVFEKYNASLR
ncbi:DUF1906 domain-containing protein [Sphaerisporangium flaviroseum]|uniref:DUF1906 domain-containing protein n=1 Tax=Sphaerisporangium flaviroseum TaxID=509199 RepID=A0ABP7HQC8_9ACTN